MHLYTTQTLCPPSVPQVCSDYTRNEEYITTRDIYYMIYEDMFLGVLDRDFAPNRMRIKTEIKAEIIRYHAINQRGV